MKRIFLLSTFLLLSLFLFGCGGNNNAFQGEPEYEGYVVDEKNGSILVVASKAKDVNEDGNADYYSALWGSNAPSRVRVGHQVEVWVDGGVDDSYPGQAKIGKVNIVSKEKPGAADLTEAEAVQKALKKLDEEKGIPVIQSAEFFEEKDRWVIKVLVKLAGEESVYNLSVKD